MVPDDGIDGVPFPRPSAGQYEERYCLQFGFGAHCITFRMTSSNSVNDYPDASRNLSHFDGR